MSDWYIAVVPGGMAIMILIGSFVLGEVKYLRCKRAWAKI